MLRAIRYIYHGTAMRISAETGDNNPGKEQAEGTYNRASNFTHGTVRTLIAVQNKILEKGAIQPFRRVPWEGLSIA